MSDDFGQVQRANVAVQRDAFAGGLVGQIFPNTKRETPKNSNLIDKKQVQNWAFGAVCKQVRAIADRLPGLKVKAGKDVAKFGGDRF